MYEEQHDFVLKVLQHLQKVALLDSSMGRDEIEVGMSLTKERNKFLVSADSFGGMSLCVTLRSCSLRTVRMSERSVEARKKVKLEGTNV